MPDYLAEVWRVFRRQRAAAGGFLALAVIVVASPSIVALTRIDPEVISADVLGRPSLAHVMGTDYLGRDILGRVLHGVNTSLLVGASVAAIALCTKASSFRASTSARTMRAICGQVVRPSITITNVSRPPKMNATASTRKNVGTIRSPSAARMMTWSIEPR